MAKFNLNQLLSGKSLNVSESDTTGQPALLKIVSLSIFDLIPSEDNFYSVENIAELKASIELFGVKQNLTVKPLDNGKYEIIVGHRRHRACIELVNEGKTDFEYVPCSIENDSDEIMKNILLIMTNSTNRQLTDWEKMKQAEELRKYFEILKKRERLPGRVRDLVAEVLNTSPTQVARMDAISNNLIDDLKEAFKEGNLGLSAAYELSGLPEEKQKEAFDEYKEKSGLSLNDVKEIKQETAPPSVENDPKKIKLTRDFKNMDVPEKVDAAINFLKFNRSKIFQTGQDMKIYKFIVEALEDYKLYN